MKRLNKLDANKDELLSLEELRRQPKQQPVFLETCGKASVLESSKWHFLDMVDGNSIEKISRFTW